MIVCLGLLSNLNSYIHFGLISLPTALLSARFGDVAWIMDFAPIDEKRKELKGLANVRFAPSLPLLPPRKKNRILAQYQ